MTTRKCHSCAHYEVVDPDEGICRRHAPRPYGTLDLDHPLTALWPEVSALDWCGDHERAKPSELQYRRRQS